MFLRMKMKNEVQTEQDDLKNNINIICINAKSLVFNIVWGLNSDCK